MEEFLDKYYLLVIDDRRPMRYNIIQSTCSHIDLSVATSNFARVGEWDAMDRYTSDSDNYPISCRFGRDLRVKMEERPCRYNLPQARWDEFQKKDSAWENWKLLGTVSSLYNDNPVSVLFYNEEIKGILSGSKTTPGRDGLSYELLKHLSNHTVIQFCVGRGSFASKMATCCDRSNCKTR